MVLFGSFTLRSLGYWKPCVMSLNSLPFCTRSYFVRWTLGGTLSTEGDGLWLGGRGQLQSHLNPGAGVVSPKGCGFVMVECAYQCGAQLQRRLLQEYQMSLSKETNWNASCYSLMQKFKAMAIDFKRVSVENQQRTRTWQSEGSSRARAKSSEAK